MSGEKYDKLADYYNVRIDYLMDRTDIKKQYPKSLIYNKEITKKIK